MQVHAGTREGNHDLGVTIQTAIGTVSIMYQYVAVPHPCVFCFRYETTIKQYCSTAQKRKNRQQRPKTQDEAPPSRQQVAPTLAQVGVKRIHTSIQRISLYLYLSAIS